MNFVTSRVAIPLLDAGYIRFIEDWGRGDAGEAEAGIIEAARQSTQGSFRGWETDSKLLVHLYNSSPPHSGPFEFAGMIIEVQAPIMVFREWQRHRTQSYAEMSARYAPLPDYNYMPSYTRIVEGAKQAGNNKQAQGIVPLQEDKIATWQSMLATYYSEGQSLYDLGLQWGIPKELARIPVTMGRYTKMRSAVTLRNWLAFLTLRMDPAAQWEIRQYANAVGELISQSFPQTWQLYHKKTMQNI